jgi:uncharacterized SAM-binding protein YcdF (DUF218 family)
MGVWRKRNVFFLIIGMLSVAIAFFCQKSWWLTGLTIKDQPVRADAIVLLAGSYEERAPSAAKLFCDGYAPLVILANDGNSSSYSEEYHRNLYEVEWSEEELVKLGVPHQNIVKLPYYGSSTMFDALAVKLYLINNGIKNIILVTSDYHTRRAFWTFRYALNASLVQITVYPAQSHNLTARSIVMEYVKYGYYLLRYGLFGLVPEMHEVVLKKH